MPWAKLQDMHGAHSQGPVQNNNPSVADGVCINYKQNKN